MADVFISYKSEDRARLRLLVTPLEADELSVWWGARIGGGERWRELIESELDGAQCVIVAWSRRSTGPEGHFVRDEAARAQKLGAYLPVRLDRVDPPLGFGETQALTLAGWRGDRDDPRYLAVLAAVRGILGREQGPERTRAPFLVHRRAVLAGGGAIGAGVAGLASWTWWCRRGFRPGADGIVVLPFSNLSGDPAQAYFADGITEEVRSALSGIARLRVIGRTSSLAVRDLAPAEIATKVGVGSVLTGSIRRSATTVRVSTRRPMRSAGQARMTARWATSSRWKAPSPRRSRTRSICDWERPRNLSEQPAPKRTTSCYARSP